MKIVLASSSPYRRELLSRFNLPFDVVNPDIDESPRLNETAKEISVRLAREKSCACDTSIWQFINYWL